MGLLQKLATFSLGKLIKPTTLNYAKQRTLNVTPQCYHWNMITQVSNFVTTIQLHIDQPGS